MTDVILEPAHHIPAILCTDVPIVGFAPGGLATALAAALAAARDMACHAVAGQGAGVVPAQAVTSNREVGAIDLDAVQRELVRQGVRIH
jgi:hypothetical protein